MLGERAVKALAMLVLENCNSDAAELVFSSKTNGLTRFYKNSVHQNVQEKEASVHIKVWENGREGMASTNVLEARALKEAADSAVEIARAGRQAAAPPELAGPSESAAVVSLDEGVARQTPLERAEQVRQFCQSAAKAGQEAYGAYQVEVGELAVANSAGAFQYHAGSLVDFQTVVSHSGASGWAQASHWTLDGVPVQALGEEAIRKAVDSSNRATIEPGSMTVVLDPYATVDLVQMLALPGMSGRAIAEGRSWISERIGEQAMHESVSIWDDGFDTAGVPRPFDAEGTQKVSVDIVRNGSVIGGVYDRETAALVGRQTTGHALSPELSPMVRYYSPLPANLFMASGDVSTQDMIASVDYGAYITRFHYTRHVHPRDCVVTGMTRDGVFLIEGGKITRAVKDLRFTQSYVEALNNIEGLGSDVRVVVDDFVRSAVSAPAVKIRDFRFTGVTV